MEMVTSKSLLNQNIVLAPFCAESVLLHHRLSLDGVNICGYFDRNPLLDSQPYCGVYIQRKYYRTNTTVILCADRFNSEIRESLLKIGYASSHILTVDDISTDADSYSAAALADTGRFAELMPAQDLGNGGGGVLKIKKLRRLRELGAPQNGMKYETFDFPGNEIFRDSDGKDFVLLRRFELEVTTRCSLKCKHCAALMQYFASSPCADAPSPADVPADIIISDYNRMLDLIDWTDDVMVMGGEPFMNRSLADVLDAIRANPETKKKVGTVHVITNGTMLPSERTMDALAAADVVVLISNYRENSRKISELLQALCRKHIRYNVLHHDGWANVQQLIPHEKPLTPEELLELRKVCTVRCRAVYEGRFYLCNFGAYAGKLGAVPYSESDSVDLYTGDAKERLVKYFDPAAPLPAYCSWCSGNSAEIWEDKIPVAEQTDRPLPYQRFK